MAPLKDILDREKEVTDKISTQVRTISAGLIVFTWSIYNAAESTLAAGMKKVLAPLLLVVDILCILALSSDFAQYLSARTAVARALADPDNIKSSDYTYDDEWISYRAQNWAFNTKIVLCGLAIALTCAVIGYALAAL